MPFTIDFEDLCQIFYGEKTDVAPEGDADLTAEDLEFLIGDQIDRDIKSQKEDLD